jgi:heat shock protein HslJ
MRVLRIGALAFFSICRVAVPQEQTATVTGKLIRAMAIGGESTGWTIVLETVSNIDGKPVHSIEIASQNIKELEQLENKRVRASGRISHRNGVETGNRSILEISSIEEIQTAAGFNLIGSEWLLEDLAGRGVIDNARATLAFPAAGKVSGHGSCNRFFGPAKIDGDAIQLGPLGATRMACPEAVMTQETKYLDALQKARRFEWKDPYLLLDAKGIEKPLRFTRLVDKKK